MAAVEYCFDERQSLVTAVVDHISELLNEAIIERGSASFLVSGGSSPQAVYEALAERQLDWSKVVVALVDERWVMQEHAASNEAFIRRSLLQNCAAAARFIGMKTAAHSAEAGLQDCETRFAALPPKADVCLLGMGSDGHTASLFPHGEGLAYAMSLSGDARCAVIHAQQSEVTGAHTERMSLTLPYLSAARQRILLITGSEKYAVYCAAKASSDFMSTPVSAVLNTDVDVYWAP
ncbi:6-phosphogluconolactonase [Zhongshania aliphaticivorans]|uniref:6-phosphogluconolactonase n=1 Tax=Zhongshania aliphaticivorans TaxID=1470434 RepID=UPI0039C92E1E